MTMFILWMILVALILSVIALSIIYEKSDNENDLRLIDKLMDIVTSAMYLVIILLLFMGIFW